MLGATAGQQSRPRRLGKKRTLCEEGCRSDHEGETLDSAVECGRLCWEGGGGWQDEPGYKGSVFHSPYLCCLAPVQFHNVCVLYHCH